MTRKPNLDRGSTQVDLNGIQEGTHPLVLEGRGATLPLDSSERLLRGYRFEGSIERLGEDYRVRGSLTGTLESVCDRCLSRFDREIVAEAMAFVTMGAVEEGERTPEGLVVLAPGSTVLDLSDAFREAALLAIPMKNVCRDDCRGICPTCGKNRNEEPCTCATSASDPRWDALRGISFPSDPKE